MEGLEVKRILIPLAFLTGCQTPPTVEKPVITYVEKRVECPSAEERERLRNLRPAPLREGTMPDDKVVRVAQSEAQLGRYEAEGGYADQVDAALDRCQTK
jgi:hypothetical protein